MEEIFWCWGLVSVGLSFPPNLGITGKIAEVTLIDKSDHFMFGFSKLDVMFAHAKARAT